MSVVERKGRGRKPTLDYDTVCEWFFCSPISLYSVISNLTIVFVGVLLLRSKVKTDAINDLQYHKAKMPMNSKMFVKYRHQVFF